MLPVQTSVQVQSYSRSNMAGSWTARVLLRWHYLLVSGRRQGKFRMRTTHIYIYIYLYLHVKSESVLEYNLASLRKKSMHLAYQQSLLLWWCHLDLLEESCGTWCQQFSLCQGCIHAIDFAVRAIPPLVVHAPRLLMPSWYLCNYFLMKAWIVFSLIRSVCWSQWPQGMGWVVINWILRVFWTSDLGINFLTLVRGRIRMQPTSYFYMGLCWKMFDKFWLFQGVCFGVSSAQDSFENKERLCTRRWIGGDVSTPSVKPTYLLILFVCLFRKHLDYQYKRRSMKFLMKLRSSRMQKPCEGHSSSWEINSLCSFPHWGCYALPQDLVLPGLCNCKLP